MRRRFFAFAIALLALGCNYDFPLSPTPSHPVDPRLLGNWTTTDEDGETEILMIRQYDADHYVVVADAALQKVLRADVARVYHTDYAGMSLFSAQVLNKDPQYRSARRIPLRSGS